MVNFKEDERLNTLNHSCAHVMAQAVKHLYPHAKFWVGPVVKEGFYYDIDLSRFHTSISAGLRILRKLM
jgi:threonyl-tRNA synthetase